MTQTERKLGKTMEPPIGESVALTRPDRCSIGSGLYCEKVLGSPPENAVSIWNDGDSTYCLCPKAEMDTDKDLVQAQAKEDTTKDPMPEDLVVSKIHEAGYAAAAFAIGPNTICKVRSWVEGTASEFETMEFVRKNAPSVPIPQVYFYWIDRAWNRSYLFMRRVPGQDLDSGWKKLSKSQRYQLAREVAAHAKSLAQFTSKYVESTDGHGLTESYLLQDVDHAGSLEPWMLPTHPRYTAEQLTSRLTAQGKGLIPPTIEDETFHFYHEDMGPSNIFVADPIPEKNSQQPILSAIIDWESAGYLPKWWVVAKPLVAPMAFNLDWRFHEREDLKVWRLSLARALHDYDFPTNPDGSAWFYAREDAMAGVEAKP